MTDSTLPRPSSRRAAHEAAHRAAGGRPDPSSCFVCASYARAAEPRPAAGVAPRARRPAWPLWLMD